MPSDVSENTSCLSPVSVSADGNCLPRSGSVLAFGHENFADEIRVRLVIELVLNEDLSERLIPATRGRIRRQGGVFDDKAAERLPISYDMYNDQSANVKLTPVTIADIYHQENIDITRRDEFMGIWQVHAMSSFFDAELVSIYPQRGNPEIRKHFHRSGMSREKRTEDAHNVDVDMCINRCELLRSESLCSTGVP